MALIMFNELIKPVTLSTLSTIPLLPNRFDVWNFFCCLEFLHNIIVSGPVNNFLTYQHEECKKASNDNESENN